MSKAPKVKKPATGKVSTIIRLPKDVTSILALDLSLNATGYALCNLETDEINMGVIAIEAKAMSEIGRLDHILGRITELTEEHDPFTGSLLVVIENFAFGAKNQAHQMGMLHGVIRHFLWKSQIPFLLIAPLQNKKWVTGKAKCDKNLVLKEIFKRYGFDVDDDNVADALGMLTLTKAVLGKWNHPLVAFQQEVVSKVLEA